MARICDDAQNEYLQIAQAVVTVPFAGALWFMSDSIDLYQGLMWLGDGSHEQRYHVLVAAGADSGDPIWMVSNSNGSRIAKSATGYTASTYHHAAGIVATSSDRRAYLDGPASKGTNTQVKSVSVLNQTTLGRYGDASPSFPLSGRIAWPAWWDLSVYPGVDDSARADYWETYVLPGLAARKSPRCFPLGLVSFPPLGGLDTEETDGGTARDIVGGFDLTAFSDATGPGVADHPGGLSYPSAGIVVPLPSAPAPPTGGPGSHVLGGGIAA